MAVLAESPAGTIESVPLKRRQLAVYLRPVKDEAGNIVEWIPTGRLPSDPISRMKYEARGFRLQNAPPTQADKEKQTLLEENAKLKAELEDWKRTFRAELDALKNQSPSPAPLYVKEPKDTKKA